MGPYEYDLFIPQVLAKMGQKLLTPGDFGRREERAREVDLVDHWHP